MVVDDNSEVQPLEFQGISEAPLFLSGERYYCCHLESFWPALVRGIHTKCCIPAQRLPSAGTLLAKDGKQAGQQGVKLAKFGPLQSWSVKHTGDAYQVRLTCQPNSLLVH
jgi:hypothetical protein